MFLFSCSSETPVEAFNLGPVNRDGRNSCLHRVQRSLAAMSRGRGRAESAGPRARPFICPRPSLESPEKTTPTFMWFPPPIQRSLPRSTGSLAPESGVTKRVIIRSAENGAGCRYTHGVNPLGERPVPGGVGWSVSERRDVSSNAILFLAQGCLFRPRFL